MDPFLHVLLAMLVGDARRAPRGPGSRVPEGDRGSARGDHDDHAQLDRASRSAVPLRHRRAATERHAVGTPISNDVAEGAKLPVFWGDPLLQGLPIGFFIALARAGRLLDHRSTGRRSATASRRSASTPRQPATAGSTSPATTSSRWRSPASSRASRARSTSSAGSSGSRRATSSASQVGFVGIAVALLGRNTAVGVAFAALLFGALVNGTSTRNLDPEVFQPELAVEPDAAHPGARRPLRRRRHHRPHALAPARLGCAGSRPRDARSPSACRRPPPCGTVAWVGIVLGMLAAFGRAAADRCANPVPPPCSGSSPSRSGSASIDPRRAPHGRLRDRRRRLRRHDRLPRDALERRQPRGRRRLVGAARGDAALRDAAGRSRRSAGSSRSARAS